MATHRAIAVHYPCSTPKRRTWKSRSNSGSSTQVGCATPEAAQRHARENAARRPLASVLGHKRSQSGVRSSIRTTSSWRARRGSTSRPHHRFKALISAGRPVPQFLQQAGVGRCSLVGILHRLRRRFSCALLGPGASRASRERFRRSALAAHHGGDFVGDRICTPNFGKFHHHAARLDPSPPCSSSDDVGSTAALSYCSPTWPCVQRTHAGGEKVAKAGEPANVSACPPGDA